MAESPTPQTEANPMIIHDIANDERVPQDKKITVKEAIKLPYESKNFSDVELTSDQLTLLINTWNAQDWPQAIAVLEELESGSKSLLPFLRHLHGIAHSLLGEWAEARGFFVENLNDRMLEDTSGVLDNFVIATANWLASTSYILRKFEDAALAWAIAASNAVHYQNDVEEETQAFTALSILNNGGYTGVEGHVELLAESLQADEKKLHILPDISGAKKAAYLTACLPRLSASPSASAAASTPSSSAIELSHATFGDPLSALGSTPVLHRDAQLVLASRAHSHTEPFGQPMAEIYLLTRFLNKVHFPLLNLTALYTTSNGIEWLVSTIRAGLQAKGFITRSCWDRMRCSRIRSPTSSTSSSSSTTRSSTDDNHSNSSDGPSDNMSYVTTFTIVFHRWPLGVKKQGFQIPLHLVRDSWNPYNPVPAATVYRRLCADVKSLLPPENTPVDYKPPVVAYSPQVMRLGWAGTTAEYARLGLGSNRYSEISGTKQFGSARDVDGKAIAATAETEGTAGPSGLAADEASIASSRKSLLNSLRFFKSGRAVPSSSTLATDASVSTVRTDRTETAAG